MKVLVWKRPIAGSGLQCGGSKPVYGEAQRRVPKEIWLAADQPCGKRLKAAVGVWFEVIPEIQARGQVTEKRWRIGLNQTK